MSYILDALRRADAERELEKAAVPGLHARPVLPVPPAASVEPSARRPRPLVIGLLALLALALAAVALFVLRDGDRPGTPRGGDAAPPTGGVEPPRLVPLPAILPQAVPPVPAQAAPAGTVTPQVPAGTNASQVPAGTGAPPVPAAAVARPARDPAAAERAPVATPPPRRDVAAPSPAAPVRSRVAASAPLAVPAAGGAVPSFRELPGPLRAELPPMTVAGSMYSADPASRMIVVDGQVLREGQSLRADLVLERIGPRSALFSFRGQRFELPF